MKVTWKGILLATRFLVDKGENKMRTQRSQWGYYLKEMGTRMVADSGRETCETLHSRTWGEGRREENRTADAVGLCVAPHVSRKGHAATSYAAEAW